MKDWLDGFVQMGVCWFFFFFLTVFLLVELDRVLILGIFSLWVLLEMCFLLLLCVLNVLVTEIFFWLCVFNLCNGVMDV